MLQCLWIIFFHVAADLFILANQPIFDRDFDPRRDIQNLNCDCDYMTIVNKSKTPLRFGEIRSLFDFGLKAN